MSSLEAVLEASQLRYPKETILPELEWLGPESVLKAIPPSLRPAVKVVRDEFSETVERWSDLAGEFCYAQLHLDGTAEQSARLRNRESACVTPVAKERLRSARRQATLSGKLKAIFNLYLDTLRDPTQHAFKGLLTIGSAHEAELTTGSVEWAQECASKMIRNQRHVALDWIRSACDRRLDQRDDWVDWEYWQAPRLLQMARRPDLYEAGRLWEPLAPDLSWRLVQALADDYVLHLFGVIDEAAGAAHRERATTPQSSAVPAPPAAADKTAAPTTMSEASQLPRKQRGTSVFANKQLTSREEKILGVIEAGLEGLAFARMLDERGLKVPQSWPRDRGPKTFESAYKLGRPWTQRINTLKSKVSKKAGLPNLPNLPKGK